MAQSANAMHQVQDIPIGFLAGAIQVASIHGYNEDSLIERFELSKKKLQDAGNRVSAAQYYRVLDYLLEQNKIPGLGLLQAAAEKISDHGLLGTAMVCSDNLGDAAQAAIKYQHLFGVPTEFFMDVRANEVAFGCLGADQALRRRWSIENMLAGCANIIRYCLGEFAHFSEVRLSYPDPGYPELYREIFNCPVTFDQDRNELCVPRNLLDISFVSANTVLRDLCLKQCQIALDSRLPGKELVEKIEGIVLASMETLPKLDVVADRLIISARTLHRRLESQGTSYRQIVERLRSRMAREYFEETTLEPKRVAYLLGYSEPANFYHAFRRWFGCTPLNYRKKHGTRSP